MENVKIQVADPRESANSYGCNVELSFNHDLSSMCSGRRVWFPKKICTYENNPAQKSQGHFITAPKWFLDKEKIWHSETFLSFKYPDGKIVTGKFLRRYLSDCVIEIIMPDGETEKHEMQYLIR